MFSFLKTILQSLPFIKKGVQSYANWRKKRSRKKLLDLHDAIRDELRRDEKD